MGGAEDLVERAKKKSVSKSNVSGQPSCPASPSLKNRPIRLGLDGSLRFGAEYGTHHFVNLLGYLIAQVAHIPLQAFHEHADIGAQLLGCETQPSDRAADDADLLPVLGRARHGLDGGRHVLGDGAQLGRWHHAAGSQDPAQASFVELLDRVDVAEQAVEGERFLRVPDRFDQRLFAAHRGPGRQGGGRDGRGRGAEHGYSHGGADGVGEAESVPDIDTAAHGPHFDGDFVFGRGRGAADFEGANVAVGIIERAGLVGER